MESTKFMFLLALPNSLIFTGISVLVFFGNFESCFLKIAFFVGGFHACFLGDAFFLDGFLGEFLTKRSNKTSNGGSNA